MLFIRGSCKIFQSHVSERFGAHGQQHFLVFRSGAGVVSVLFRCATTPVGEKWPTFGEIRVVETSIFRGNFYTWRWDHAVLKDREPIKQWRGAISQHNGDTSIVYLKTGVAIWVFRYSTIFIRSIQFRSFAGFLETHNDVYRHGTETKRR